MTHAELEAIRQADAEDDPRGGLQARIDRRALLGHVDTLELKVGVQGRLIRMLSRRRTEQTFDAARLLAHQQARNILDDAGATRLWLALDEIAQQGCIGDGGYPPGGRCYCSGCIAEDALVGEVGTWQLDVVRSENATLRAENERLRVVNVSLVAAERDEARAENQRLNRANVDLVAQASSREHDRKQLRSENARKDAELDRLREVLRELVKWGRPFEGTPGHSLFDRWMERADDALGEEVRDDAR